MSTPTHPMTVLVEQLVKAIAVEVVRLQDKQRRPSPSGLISAAEIGRRVGRSTRTIKNWLRAGVMKPHIVRGCWYARSEDFEKFLATTDGKRRRSMLKVAS